MFKQNYKERFPAKATHARWGT